MSRILRFLIRSALGIEPENINPSAARPRRSASIAGPSRPTPPVRPGGGANLRRPATLARIDTTKDASRSTITVTATHTAHPHPLVPDYSTAHEDFRRASLVASAQQTTCENTDSSLIIQLTASCA